MEVQSSDMDPHTQTIIEITNQCQVGAELLTSLHGTIGIIWPEHLGSSCYRQARGPDLSSPSQKITPQQLQRSRNFTLKKGCHSLTILMNSRICFIVCLQNPILSNLFIAILILNTNITKCRQETLCSVSGEHPIEID